MMRALLLAPLLVGSSAAFADDPPPPAKAVQPKALPGVQPAPFRNVSPTVLARYEEEAEILDAQLNVKMAFIKAAEVGVNAAKVKLDRASKLAGNKAITEDEVQMAKLDLDSAIAQLEIRRAETKEVEVKLKYAKKRLDDAKASVRPVAPRPAVDPTQR